MRREKERQLQAQEGSTGLPWPLLLLFSIFTAIAAVGSIFEYIDRNAIFGVVGPDSQLWAPILLFFAVTGFPTAGAFAPAIVNDTSVWCYRMSGYIAGMWDSARVGAREGGEVTAVAKPGHQPGPLLTVPLTHMTSFLLHNLIPPQ